MILNVGIHIVHTDFATKSQLHLRRLLAHFFTSPPPRIATTTAAASLSRPSHLQRHGHLSCLVGGGAAALLLCSAWRCDGGLRPPPLQTVHIICVSELVPPLPGCRGSSTSSGAAVRRASSLAARRRSSWRAWRREGVEGRASSRRQVCAQDASELVPRRCELLHRDAPFHSFCKRYNARRRAAPRRRPLDLAAVGRSGSRRNCSRVHVMCAS